MGWAKTHFFAIFLELLPLYCIWGVCLGEIRFRPRRAFFGSDQLSPWRPRRARGAGLPLTHYSATTNRVYSLWRQQIDVLRGAPSDGCPRNLLKGSQEKPLPISHQERRTCCRLLKDAELLLAGLPQLVLLPCTHRFGRKCVNGGVSRVLSGSSRPRHRRWPRHRRHLRPQRLRSPVQLSSPLDAQLKGSIGRAPQNRGS